MPSPVQFLTLLGNLKLIMFLDSTVLHTLMALACISSPDHGSKPHPCMFNCLACISSWISQEHFQHSMSPTQLMAPPWDTSLARPLTVLSKSVCQQRHLVHCVPPSWHWIEDYRRAKLHLFLYYLIAICLPQQTANSMKARARIFSPQHCICQ